MSLILPVDDETHLRLMEPHHAEAVWPLVQTHRAHLQRWLPWPYEVNSLDECRAAIAKLHEAFGRRETMALSIMHGQQVIGGVGWNDWEQRVSYNGSLQHASADIGYWLIPNAQSRGIVTRCVIKLTGIGFEEYKLRRLTIRAELDNQKSWSVPERCGYTREGTLRHVARFNGRDVHHHLYAAYAATWQAPERLDRQGHTRPTPPETIAIT